MKDRERFVAQSFGVLDRIEALEKRLLEIDHIVDVEFDLDGFWDDIRQVIIVPEFEVSAKEPDYFNVLKDTLNRILAASKEFGLLPSGDTIENQGKHFYIVRNCDDSWVLNYKKDIEPETSKYTFVDSKSVLDSDGFQTDYTWYAHADGTQVFVFGDNDIYLPEDGYFDHTCDSETEAREWFDSYRGFEEINESLDDVLNKATAESKNTSINIAVKEEFIKE